MTPSEDLSAEDLSGQLEDLSGQLEDLSGQLESRLRLSPELASQPPKVRVILSDHCYEHIFSRQWVGKRYLNSIVERPERLRAVSLGVGLALETHKGEIECVKSQRRENLTTTNSVQRVHGPTWAGELYELCHAAAAKLQVNSIEVPDTWPSDDMYLCGTSIAALEGSVGAVFDGLDALYQDGLGPKRVFVAARPPGHHCHAYAASGFCLVNNVLIGAQYAAETHGTTLCVVIDFDLHHGDGTQDICWNYAERGEEDIKDDKQTASKDNDKEDVQHNAKEQKIQFAYLSLHDINSYPTELGYAHGDRLKDASVCIVAHNRAVWNVHLEPWTSSEEFDALYTSKYRAIVDRARAVICEHQKTTRNAKPLIVISAGFDASEYELESMQRHKVSVPSYFYHQLTADVCAIDPEVPVLSVLEGGYSDAALATGVFSHLSGFVDPDAPSQGPRLRIPQTQALTTAGCAKLLIKGCSPGWKRPGGKSRQAKVPRDGTSFGNLVDSSAVHVAKTAPFTTTTAAIQAGIETGRGLWPRVKPSSASLERNLRIRKPT